MGVGEKDADGKEVEDVEGKKVRWLGRRDGGKRRDRCIY